MRRLILVVIFVLSLFLVTGSAYAEGKYAYIDLARVFDGYNKTKGYDKLLEKKQKAYEEEREKKLEEIKKLQEQLGLLSEQEKETRKSELEDKIAKLQEFDRKSTQDLRDQRDEKIQEIFKDINKAIEAYSKKQGIIIVFDKRALVYNDASLDITKPISEVLNKE